MDTDKYVIRVYADADMKERLKKVGKQLGLTALSTIARFILNDYLKNHTETK